MSIIKFRPTATIELQKQVRDQIVRPDDLYLLAGSDRLDGDHQNTDTHAEKTAGNMQKQLPDWLSSSKEITKAQMMAVPRSQLLNLVLAWFDLAGQPEQTSQDQLLQSKLQQILAQRVSASLLAQVWSCYQLNYNANGASAFLLSLIKAYIEGNRQKHGERISISWLCKLAEHAAKDSSGQTFDPLGSLEQVFKQQEEAQHYRDLLYQQEHLAIRHPALLTYLRRIFPDQEVHFELDDLKHKPLCSLLIALDILIDSPFLLKLLAAYFTSCKDGEILSNQYIWLYAMHLQGTQQQAGIIQYYLRSFRLDRKWYMLNKAIEERIWQSDILMLLDQQARRHFSQWQLADRLNRQITEQPRKELFYNSYLLQIRDIKDWNDHILIVHFGGFVLADDKDQPGSLLFIERLTYDMLVEGEHTDLLHFAGKQEDELPTARELSIHPAKHSIIRLPLDDVNLLYAHDLVSAQLKATAAKQLKPLPENLLHLSTPADKQDKRPN